MILRAVIILLLTFPAYGEKDVALSDLAQQAAAASTLTVKGGQPFRLKMAIVETTNPDSTYRAEVEEYWVSVDKWRRVIKSPGFSQTLIVNGDKSSEQDAGEYYPSWLRTLVTAALEPLPMLEQLKQSKAEIHVPRWDEHFTPCARFQSVVGTPPAQNSVFSVFCFVGKPIVVASITTPGYAVQFKDYQAFGDRRVARRLISDPEPGTTIEARITQLSVLSDPDESLFAVTETTLATERIRSVQIGDSVARTLLTSSPSLQWPSPRGGKTSGVLSLYVGVGRSGQVGEVWPLNSDNPVLDDAAREQVRNWKFKPATVDGVAVQFEAVLTFAFDTKTENPIPVLSDKEARKLATHTADPELSPHVAPSGTLFTLRVSVDPQGKILGVININNLPDALFVPGWKAIERWRFQPYLIDGKGTRFDADITFRVW